MQVTSLHTFPVKGLSSQEHVFVPVKAGQVLAGDRAFAIENGTREFDAINPRYMTKQRFLQRMNHEQLAELETSFDADRNILAVQRGGKPVLRANLGLPVGRQMLEQFLSGFLGSNARGTPRVVQSPGHHFCDVPERYVSLINLGSVRDLERITGQPVNPLRFRGNLYIDGADPWSELKWLGKTLSVNGQEMFRVSARITRCAAINVDPETGQRDMALPRLIGDVFGHEDCGLYLTAIADGKLAKGDIITLG